MARGSRRQTPDAFPSFKKRSVVLDGTIRRGKKKVDEPVRFAPGVAVTRLSSSSSRLPFSSWSPHFFNTYYMNE